MPTNITPDWLGTLGNGIVKSSLPLTVTWQVNGNSPMTKYKIDFYSNDATSALLYTTGEQTTNCPFYGTDSLGNPVLFYHEITSGLDLTATAEWKLVITQWWSNNDYVVQASPSAFTVRSTPTLTLPVSTVTTREHTFTATYTQAEGDALNWVRWRIAINTPEGKADPLYDSGNIYNTSILTTTYDGFFSGTTYAIRCQVETQNGVIADTGWEAFACAYSMQSLVGTVDAKQTCGKSAVRVEWNGFRYISGVASGDYTITDGILSLDGGSSVQWNEVNGSPMSLSNPWYIAYKGKLKYADALLLAVEMDDTDTITMSYTNATRSLVLALNGTSLTTLSGVSAASTITAVITEDAFYYRIEYMSGGLHPSTTLYPSTALYPSADDTPAFSINNVALSYTQGDITSVEVGGTQDCDYVQILEGTATASTQLIIDAITNGTYSPEATDGTVFLADFNNELNAGTLYIAGTEINGWAIYRTDDTYYAHIADVGMEQSVVYDYSARSEQGPYTYHVYPIGTATYITRPMVSNPIKPRFWNWSILECAQLKDGVYGILREFAFGKNLSSGAVSNNNNPSVAQNFTRYPSVQLTNHNYRSGSLSSLIGTVSLSNGTIEYHDTLEMRDEIEELSTTTNYLFLKSRKGDLMEVRISGAISFATADNSPTQALTVTIPWVQIGDATKGVSIILEEGESAYV